MDYWKLQEQRAKELAEVNSRHDKILSQFREQCKHQAGEWMYAGSYGEEKYVKHCKFCFKRMATEYRDRS